MEGSKNLFLTNFSDILIYSVSFIDVSYGFNRYNSLILRPFKGVFSSWVFYN
jgi:hypothetical protein